MSKNIKQFIEDRQKKGIKAYEGLDEFGAWDGWYKTLSSLYPDNAHFVFELLQNAEDAKATKVKFELIDGSLSFKHNGSRDFNESDVYSITNVGDSKKQEETNQIGKFGVGFKSVFAYTTSPKIHSKTIDFEIENLFIPSLIDTKPIEEGYTTLFIFPFDRGDKPKAQAFSEVKELFDELNDNVLLFLTNIQSIEWQIANSRIQKITRENDNDLFEITNTQKGTSHWLVYSNEINIKDESLKVSVAYKYNKEKNEIEPIRGDVSIFFPAKKETSKLKFHIDAPFSSTVARDSIAESTENEKIMVDIANLCRESVHKIKDRGLLSMSFFEVLPNKDDELDIAYMPFFEGLVEEFESNDHNLIPLEGGAFGSINSSIYCSRIVRDTFTDQDDIYNLLNDETILGFAKFPLKNSRSDKFLSELEGLIEYEDFEIFDLLYEIANNVSDEMVDDVRKWALVGGEYNFDDLNLALSRREWLESKSDVYLQRLYAFFSDTIDQYSESYGIRLDGKYNNYYDLIHIIKLGDGSFNYGGYNIYFPDTNTVSEDNFRFVSIETYTSGKSKNKQQKSKTFLEKIGVEDIDELTHINLLFDGYEFISEKEHLNNINRLVDWYLEEQKNISSDHEPLKRITFSHKKFVYSENNELNYPFYTYIDEPFKPTGVRYIDEAIKSHALHPIYLKLDNLPIFIEILTKLGCQISLEITKEYLSHTNPYYFEMRRKWRWDGGEKENYNTIKEDWNINKLPEILSIEENKFEISKLILKAINNAEISQFTAKFRGSKAYTMQISDSLLIHNLKNHEWIPDSKEGVFHKPCDITKEMLPDEFIPNNSNGWLDAVDFGKNITERNEEYQKDKDVLAEYGFTPEEANRFKKIPKEEINKFLKEQEVKSLVASIREKQGTGETEGVAPQRGESGHITDIKKHQKNIEKENKEVDTGTHQGERKMTAQDQKQLQGIKEYLYQQYNGHCQLCGDTFQRINKINHWNLYSMNRMKKGDNEKSDVNRKGNTICLCPKHHAIITYGDSNFAFGEILPEPGGLTLPIINDLFHYYDDVGNTDIDNDDDSFYNTPDGSDFERDVHMLPIKFLNKTFYLKFTRDHIMQFIEVWNSN